jgi:hypothetical protein
MDVRSAGKAGHGPSSIFGICEPMSSFTVSSWAPGTRTELSPSSQLTPRRSNPGQIADMCSGTTSSMKMSPSVTAARPMKLATSM